MTEAIDVGGRGRRQRRSTAVTENLAIGGGWSKGKTMGGWKVEGFISSERGE